MIATGNSVHNDQVGGTHTSKIPLAKHLQVVVCSTLNRGPIMTHKSGRAQSDRYPIQLPLLYWRKTGTRTRVGAGWTRELGEGGFTAELAERFEVNTPLRVRIQTDRGPIETEAQIRWIGASTPAGAENYYGLSFTDIAPGHLQALRDLILPLSMVAHAGMRLAMNLSVTCRPKNAGGSPLKGETGEMSRGGMLLRLPRLIVPGTVLDITLHSSNGPLALEGTVVWSETSETQKPGGLIDHGVRFTSSTWSVSLALGFLLAGRP